MTQPLNRIVLALVLASVARLAAATVTETILLNAYDIQNVTLSDQHGGAGWFVGRHNTFDRLLDGGNDRPWLPAGDTQNIYWQMVYPTSLALSQVRINISNDLGGANFTATGGKIQYTTVASPGPGDWADLVTGINTAGEYTYNAPGNFAALNVHGLRWFLPPEGVTDGGDWKPYLLSLHALGTNTVENDKRFNLMPNHATVTTNVSWTFTGTSTAGVNDNNPTPRAMWNSGALAAGATLLFTLDKPYFLDTLWMDWEGLGQSFRPNSYDLYYSNDGSSWTLFVNDHSVAADGTQDFFSLNNIQASYVELRDFKGANGGHVILHEAMLYGAVPEPAALTLLALAGTLPLLRRRR